MAIAGSLIKGATKVVGKAINVAKKKKKDLEAKGKVTKKKAKEKIIEEAKNKKDQSGTTIRENIKGVDAVPSAVAGAVGSTATKVGGKAINIAKNPKETINKVKDKVKSSAKKAGDEINLGAERILGKNSGLAGDAIGIGVGSLVGLGAASLTASLLKSNAKPEQEYTTKRLPDGRFSTSFGGNNANVVFANKQLSEKQINEVRTQLAVLDSIIDSSDPKARSKEFTETVEMLSKKYGISNITGKNLSVLIPMNK